MEQQSKQESQPQIHQQRSADCNNQPSNQSQQPMAQAQPQPQPQTAHGQNQQNYLKVQSQQQQQQSQQQQQQSQQQQQQQKPPTPPQQQQQQQTIAQQARQPPPQQKVAPQQQNQNEPMQGNNQQQQPSPPSQHQKQIQQQQQQQKAPQRAAVAPQTNAQNKAEAPQQTQQPQLKKQNSQGENENTMPNNQQGYHQNQQQKQLKQQQQKQQQHPPPAPAPALQRPQQQQHIPAPAPSMQQQPTAPSQQQQQKQQQKSLPPPPPQQHQQPPQHQQQQNQPIQSTISQQSAPYHQQQYNSLSNDNHYQSQHSISDASMNEQAMQPPNTVMYQIPGVVTLPIDGRLSADPSIGYDEPSQNQNALSHPTNTNQQSRTGASQYSNPQTITKQSNAPQDNTTLHTSNQQQDNLVGMVGAIPVVKMQGGVVHVVKKKKGRFKLLQEGPVISGGTISSVATNNNGVGTQNQTNNNVNDQGSAATSPAISSQQSNIPVQAVDNSRPPTVKKKGRFVVTTLQDPALMATPIRMNHVQPVVQTVPSNTLGYQQGQATPQVFQAHQRPPSGARPLRMPYQQAMPQQQQLQQFQPSAAQLAINHDNSQQQQQQQLQQEQYQQQQQQFQQQISPHSNANTNESLPTSNQTFIGGVPLMAQHFSQHGQDQTVISPAIVTYSSSAIVHHHPVSIQEYTRMPEPMPQNTIQETVTPNVPSQLPDNSRHQKVNQSAPTGTALVSAPGPVENKASSTAPKTQNNVAVPEKARTQNTSVRKSNNRAPPSIRNKTPGSPAGLGKVFYFLDQMKSEVSEADRTIKNLQTDVRLLRDKNKELEAKNRELDKKVKEEKAAREAAEVMIKKLKRLITDNKNGTVPPRNATNGEDGALNNKRSDSGELPEKELNIEPPSSVKPQGNVKPQNATNSMDTSKTNPSSAKPAETQSTMTKPTPRPLNGVPVANDSSPSGGDRTKDPMQFQSKPLVKPSGNNNEIDNKAAGVRVPGENTGSIVSKSVVVSAPRPATENKIIEQEKKIDSGSVTRQAQTITTTQKPLTASNFDPLGPTSTQTTQPTDDQYLSILSFPTVTLPVSGCQTVLQTNQHQPPTDANSVVTNQTQTDLNQSPFVIPITFGMAPELGTQANIHNFQQQTFYQNTQTIESQQVPGTSDFHGVQQHTIMTNGVHEISQQPIMVFPQQQPIMVQTVQEFQQVPEVWNGQQVGNTTQWQPYVAPQYQYPVPNAPQNFATNMQQPIHQQHQQVNSSQHQHLQHHQQPSQQQQQSVPAPAPLAAPNQMQMQQQAKPNTADPFDKIIGWNGIS